MNKKQRNKSLFKVFLALLIPAAILTASLAPSSAVFAGLAPKSLPVTLRSDGPQFGSILDKYAQSPELSVKAPSTDSKDPTSQKNPSTAGAKNLNSLSIGRPLVEGSLHRVIPLPAVLESIGVPGGSHNPALPNNRPRSTFGNEPTGGDNRLRKDFFQNQVLEDHEQVRQTLIKVAEAFGEEAQYVPYVWGGNQIGDTEACQACRSCIAKKSRLSVEKRKSVCKPCRQCGIDCSHFVHRVFRDAGLEFPYVNTASLRRMSPLALREDLRLIDLGRDISAVMPGDLLLKKKHIVVFLRSTEAGRGDVLHVSRSTQKMGPGGGIEIARNVDLANFAGRLVKILRHIDTIEKSPSHSREKPEAPKSSPDLLLWSPHEKLVNHDPQRAFKSSMPKKELPYLSKVALKSNPSPATALKKVQAY